MFLAKTWPLSLSFDLEAAGSRPVVFIVGLLLCGNHWQKVLMGKDPTDKAYNTADSGNGVDICSTRGHSWNGYISCNLLLFFSPCLWKVYLLQVHSNTWPFAPMSPVCNSLTCPILEKPCPRSTWKLGLWKTPSCQVHQAWPHTALEVQKGHSHHLTLPYMPYI